MGYRKKPGRKYLQIRRARLAWTSQGCAEKGSLAGTLLFLYCCLSWRSGDSPPWGTPLAATDKIQRQRDQRGEKCKGEAQG